MNTTLRRYSESFDYSGILIPRSYCCHQCGVSRVRLYRRYQTFLEYQALFCRACALVNQNMKEPDQPDENSIGWLVAAVPTEDGETYWGYTSVPSPGVQWWLRLPKE